MMNKIRVSIPTEIPNIDEDVDTNLVEVKLNDYVKSLEKKINTSDFGDWALKISIIIRWGDGIGVSKRIARYPSDKEFGIYMSIPIPNENQAPYGSEKVKTAFFQAVDEKWSYFIKPRFDGYSNLIDYVVASGKEAIDLSFTKGFTCNGKKIKFQS